MCFERLSPARVLTGICLLALNGFSQTYTVSAKPGALNFIQGDVSINGEPVWKANLKSTFLNADDLLAVENGKVEVLLTPGVFLRVGEFSKVRILKASLVEMRLEVISGESMVEVDDVVPGSMVQVIDHGSSTVLNKNGLFRFTEYTIAALDGKAQVSFGARKITLSKEKVVKIDEEMHASKLDLKQPDDLYAWSNNRALTNAAATYAGSTSVYNAGGYGFSSYNSPGWYWASNFDSYMWLPGNGAFYSPFGWGFYGPGVVSYAPVMLVPGGYFNGAYNTVQATMPTQNPIKTGVKPVTSSTSGLLPVPVNPANVGSLQRSSSPASLTSARTVNQNYANFYGLQTARGTAPAVLHSGQTFGSMQQAGRAAEASSHAAAYSRSSESGYSGGGSSSHISSSSTFSSASQGSMSVASHGGGSSSGHSK